MRTLPLFVAISVFSIITFFTPGCSVTSTHSPPTPPEAGTRDSAYTASDVETVRKEDRPDFFTPEPIAHLLPPTTCHGRQLPEDAPGIELAGEGAILWHLCYTTPTPSTSTHALAAEHPERVHLSVSTPGGERLLFASPVPRDENPWTISLLVALPIGMAPAFQGAVWYTRHQRLGIVARAQAMTLPTIHGLMRSWRVLRSRSQDEYAPTRVCHRPTALDSDNAFFLPLDTCPGQTCPLLERLDCRLL